MNGTVRELMTPDPVAVDESTPLQQVALVMREEDIGDVIVERQGSPAGIVTDRDIVVRALAEGEDARTLQAGDICSGDVLSVAPDDDIDEAASLMREAAVRRVPVIDDGRVVGIVSLGDLARADDPGSVLSDISEEPPNA
jgi:CBS domain-containing protein